MISTGLHGNVVGTNGVTLRQLLSASEDRVKGRGELSRSVAEPFTSSLAESTPKEPHG